MFASAALLALAAFASATPTPSPKPELVERQQQGGNPAPFAGPLTAYHYPYSAIPEKVNPYSPSRGPQSGYNRCNSTTSGSDSLCQTLIFNNISDFCIWGSDQPNNVIGNVEAETVAYCINPQWGGRQIPNGAITGLQFVRTSAYIQIVGFIDQTALNLQASDAGGELDPHGADQAGNPLGSLVYSNNLPGDNGQLNQVNNWNNFVGGGVFCLKACVNSITNPDYCQNRYDLIGCTYNMPASYGSINGTFTSCDSDLQLEVGKYVEDGVTKTFYQGDTAPATIPYQPQVPASSNCVTYQSTQLFTAIPTPTSSASSSSGSSSASNSASSGQSQSPQNTGSPSGGDKPSSAVMSADMFGVAFGCVFAGLLAGAVML